MFVLFWVLFLGLVLFVRLYDQRAQGSPAEAEGGDWLHPEVYDAFRRGDLRAHYYYTRVEEELLRVQAQIRQRYQIADGNYTAEELGRLLSERICSDAERALVSRFLEIKSRVLFGRHNLSVDEMDTLREVALLVSGDRNDLTAAPAGTWGR